MTVRQPRFFFVIALAVAIGAITSSGGAMRPAAKPFEGPSSVRFIAIGDTGTGHQDQFDVARDGGLLAKGKIK